MQRKSEKRSNGRVSANVQALTELLLSATHTHTDKNKEKLSKPIFRQTDNIIQLHAYNVDGGDDDGGGGNGIHRMETASADRRNEIHWKILWHRVFFFSLLLLLLGTKIT